MFGLHFIFIVFHLFPVIGIQEYIFVTLPNLVQEHTGILVLPFILEIEVHKLQIGVSLKELLSNGLSSLKRADVLSFSLLYSECREIKSSKSVVIMSIVISSGSLCETSSFAVSPCRQ